MSVTTNALAGPEAHASWDSSIDQEPHTWWTKTWGPDKSYEIPMRKAKFYNVVVDKQTGYLWIVRAQKGDKEGAIDTGYNLDDEN